MRKLILFSTVLFSYFANAQEVAVTTELQEIDVKKYKTTVFSDDERPAKFPKGLIAFKELFAKKFKERKVISKGEEKCELTFVIQKDGTLTEITKVLIMKLSEQFQKLKKNGFPLKSTDIK